MPVLSILVVDWMGLGASCVDLERSSHWQSCFDAVTDAPPWVQVLRGPRTVLETCFAVVAVVVEVLVTMVGVPGCKGLGSSIDWPATWLVNWAGRRVTWDENLVFRQDSWPADRDDPQGSLVEEGQPGEVRSCLQATWDESQGHRRASLPVGCLNTG